MGRTPEKTKLLIHRIIWGVLLLTGILVLTVNPPTKAVEIVNDSGYINNYYAALDETSVDIEIEFNVAVDSGDITVAFYDADDKCLVTESEYFWGGDKKVSRTFYGIPGKVASYEIINFENTAYVDTDYKYYFYLPCLIALIMLISSLLLSCKVYQYNEQTIIVYAGWYHHYLKINDEIFDEHNTILSYSAITLSCKLANDTEVIATISLTNRIALKINGKLYTKPK